MNISVARVDERLIHGQIINAWYTRNNISHILIVDEELVEDQFMTNVYKALTPLSIQVEVFGVDGIIDFLKANSDIDGRILLLSRTLSPIVRLVEKGIRPDCVLMADKSIFQIKFQYQKKTSSVLTGWQKWEFPRLRKSIQMTNRC